MAAITPYTKQNGTELVKSVRTHGGTAEYIPNGEIVILWRKPNCAIGIYRVNVLEANPITIGKLPQKLFKELKNNKSDLDEDGVYIWTGRRTEKIIKSLMDTEYRNRTVSENHVQIYYEDGKVIIEDVGPEGKGSINGTRLDCRLKIRRPREVIKGIGGLEVILDSILYKDRRIWGGVVTTLRENEAALINITPLPLFYEDEYAELFTRGQPVIKISQLTDNPEEDYESYFRLYYRLPTRFLICYVVTNQEES